ncbi:MAG: bifunctional folylpolyglutamate synthase/dihydrofolate synthase, partial [Tenericutes bacterium HGW-Tenericutes-3]
MLKNIGEAITWIESQVRFKPKADLKRMTSAYRRLRIDLSGIKKIHVAGTNGKGSVCAYISHILIESGYKVGTYTSPYLISFNERIRYQFQNIDDKDLYELILSIYFFNQSFEKSYGESLSFFELLTLMSFMYFEKMKVDVMVIEVGIGGLLDATNIL